MRDRLLDAAIDVLAADGVAGVTTRRVAAEVGASAPAIYELFGDKSGLVRAVFFEGFRRLGSALADLPPPTGAVDDLVRAASTFRAFAQANPRLFEVMYTRPFADFDPSTAERDLGGVTRRALIDRIDACVESGALRADPTDIAHALLGLVIGLVTEETGGWLGAKPADRDRRWRVAIEAMLTGFGG